jgi:hypothetical protein
MSGSFFERLHPRDREGKFAHKLGELHPGEVFHTRTGGRLRVVAHNSDNGKSRVQDMASGKMRHIAPTAKVRREEPALGGRMTGPGRGGSHRVGTSGQPLAAQYDRVGLKVWDDYFATGKMPPAAGQKPSENPLSGRSSLTPGNLAKATDAEIAAHRLRYPSHEGLRREAEKRQPGKFSLPAGSEAYEQMKATAAALGLPWDDAAMRKKMGIAAAKVPDPPREPPSFDDDMEAMDNENDHFDASMNTLLDRLGAAGHDNPNWDVKADLGGAYEISVTHEHTGDHLGTYRVSPDSVKHLSGPNVLEKKPSATPISKPSGTSYNQYSVGRGPKGNVRNVKAMSDGKLVAEWHKVLTEYPPDDEVKSAWKSEMRKRNITITEAEARRIGALRSQLDEAVASGANSRVAVLRQVLAVAEATLSSASRKKLPKSAFAIPPDRYPIHDEAHARNALARVAQHGTPEEKAKVRAAVHRRYPKIGKAA